jgi:hypothetical protein
LTHSALQFRFHQVGSSERELLLRPVVLGYLADLFVLGASKPSEGIGAVGSSDQASFAEVVLGLQVLDFGFIRAVDNANRDRENGVALT